MVPMPSLGVRAHWLRNTLMLGQQREGHFPVTSCELNSFRIQAHTIGTPQGLAYTHRITLYVICTRTVWISQRESPGAHSPPDYGLRKKRPTAGRKAKLTRSACSDWAIELPVTKRDRLAWSWRAGLLRSQAWSLVKPAGRGGQEGGTPRLPVGGLRRGVRGDGRGDAQGGARSTETALRFVFPPPSISVHSSLPSGSWAGPKPRSSLGCASFPGERAKRRLPRAQGPGHLGDSVGAPLPTPGWTPPAVLRASGPRDGPGQCIRGAQGPWERGGSAATPPICQRAGSGGLRLAPPSSPGV